VSWRQEKVALLRGFWAKMEVRPVHKGLLDEGERELF